VQEDHFVEEGVDVQGLAVLHDGHWVLPVEVDDQISGEIALPVHFDDEVVVSGVELHPHAAIPVAVNEVVDVGAEGIGGLVQLGHDESDQGVLIGLAELAVILLDQGDIPLCPLTGPQVDSSEFAA
jgi:hypothetical protein